MKIGFDLNQSSDDLLGISESETAFEARGCSRYCAFYSVAKRKAKKLSKRGAYRL